MLTDELVAGPLLIERLKDKCPDFKDVLTFESRAKLVSGISALRSPSCLVMFDGETVESLAEARSVQAPPPPFVRQRWVLIIAVKNLRYQKGAENSDAGPLKLSVHRAVHGWRPSADFRDAFVRINSYAPDYLGDFAYFPLSFETRLIVH